MDLRGYGWSRRPRATRSTRPIPSAPWARDVIPVMEALGQCVSRWSDTIAERVWAIGSRSIIPAAWSARPSRHPADLSCLGADESGQGAAGALGLSLASLIRNPKTEIGRDPIPYFEGLMRQWSAAGDLSAFDQRALARLLAGLQRTHAHPCLLRGLPRRRHAGHRSRRSGSRRRQDDPVPDLTDLERLLPRARHRSATRIPPLEVWRRTFAPKVTGIGVTSGHFVAEENPGATLEALQAFLKPPEQLIAAPRRRPSAATPPRFPGCRHRLPARGGRWAAGRSGRRSRPRRPSGRGRAK